MAANEAVSKDAKLNENSKISKELGEYIVRLVQENVMPDGNKTESDIAELLRKEVEKNYGTHWHCIIGRNFGR